jgi:hypothetical protein
LVCAMRVRGDRTWTGECAGSRARVTFAGIASSPLLWLPASSTEGTTYCPKKLSVRSDNQVPISSASRRKLSRSIYRSLPDRHVYGAAEAAVAARFTPHLQAGSMRDDFARHSPNFPVRRGNMSPRRGRSGPCACHAPRAHFYFRGNVRGWGLTTGTDTNTERALHSLRWRAEAPSHYSARDDSPKLDLQFVGS